MIAFINNGHNWIEERDNLKILEETDVVFAESVEDAVNLLNNSDIYNPHGDDFVLFRVGYRNKTYNDKNPLHIIDKYSAPQLKDMPLNSAMKHIKSRSCVHLSNNSIIKEWEKEIGDSLETLGIVKTGWASVEYDPERARKELKNRKAREKRRKKSSDKYTKFIYTSDLANFIRGMSIKIEELMTRNYMHYIYFNRTYPSTKFGLCEYIFLFIPIFELFFGKKSYRKIDEFQKLKAKWKKGKPEIPKDMTVNQKFFDFMNKEVKIRKPRNNNLKSKLGPQVEP